MESPFGMYCHLVKLKDLPTAPSVIQSQTTLGRSFRKLQLRQIFTNGKKSSTALQKNSLRLRSTWKLIVFPLPVLPTGVFPWKNFCQLGKSFATYLVKQSKLYEIWEKPKSNRASSDNDNGKFTLISLTYKKSSTASRGRFFSIIDFIMTQYSFSV